MEDLPPNAAFDAPSELMDCGTNAEAALKNITAQAGPTVNQEKRKIKVLVVTVAR